MRFKNPILPGFYPDPSVCRVGEDYYLVTSSFEYFPGIPVFRSKDLVNWEQVGHVLTRRSQLDIQRVESSGGIFAPTIRYIKGKFYLVVTLTNIPATSFGKMIMGLQMKAHLPHKLYTNFIVTADNPEGPWSDPIFLDGQGIDPSLFEDEDGKVYYTRQEPQKYFFEDCVIRQQEYSPEKKELVGKMRTVWKGTGGPYLEAPHLYKINGLYYLLAAEGGTSYHHMIVVARADSPWGPFENCPHNPLICHLDKKDFSVQATGHGDLVRAHDGSWWIVFLGIRPKGGYFHNLGRETFLEPVTWKDGWPVINKGEGCFEEEEGPSLYHRAQETAKAFLEDFDKPELDLRWNFIRNPHEENYSLTDKKGYLRLRGSNVALSDLDSPSFVGVRQSNHKFRAKTLLEFDPTGEETAGICLINGRLNHVELLVGKGSVRLIQTRKRTGKELARMTIGDAVKGFTLEIEASEKGYAFFCSLSAGDRTRIGNIIDSRDLSTEDAGAMNFTGVYIGICAFSKKKGVPSSAYFDKFSYEPLS
jgi:xylan 1,4-beta-xylosidase